MFATTKEKDFKNVDAMDGFWHLAVARYLFCCCAITASIQRIPLC
ncbi:hypothetical protein THOG11_140169 [Vibrio harveyi]|nr:hypothetical protein TH15OA1_480018 [Vibrio harveyi]CAH1551458.1 hypothetical protein THOD03_150159 [Vibrio harveyi]CAH1556014.1 hypothetical protein THOG11_140169 [Vibrio harveyi]